MLRLELPAPTHIAPHSPRESKAAVQREAAAGEPEFSEPRRLRTAKPILFEG